MRRAMLAGAEEAMAAEEAVGRGSAAGYILLAAMCIWRRCRFRDVLRWEGAEGWVTTGWVLGGTAAEEAAEDWVPWERSIRRTQRKGPTEEMEERAAAAEFWEGLGEREARATFPALDLGLRGAAAAAGAAGRIRMEEVAAMAAAAAVRADIRRILRGKDTRVEVVVSAAAEEAALRTMRVRASRAMVVAMAGRAEPIRSIATTARAAEAALRWVARYS